MQPLLHETSPARNKGKRDVIVGHTTTADIDSEQDDTLYVLTQMQKSRESLAVSISLLNKYLNIHTNDDPSFFFL